MEEEKYEQLEVIGRGSFGTIRKVRRKSDGYILCRKEISYLRMSSKEREQLQSELSILKGLRHPNIVAYYEREHIKTSSDLHIYMEYCEDGDLARRIKHMKATGQMAPEEFVWGVFSQLVCALYRCHYGQDPPEIGTNALGLGPDVKVPKNKNTTMILHRDLKPDNIFLGADGSVKLGDFGLSKIIASHDLASTYVGTPFYMSPEICAAENYGWHSDIWALGCVVYELCAKEPPFNAKTHFELIQKIRLGRIKPLSSVYSKELQDLIQQCLRVNPQTRPDTAQLLNVYMIKIKRKEMEVVDMGKRLQKEIEAAKRAREESDRSVRMEWEVKARLEIDRQVELGTSQMRKELRKEMRAEMRHEMQEELRQELQKQFDAKLEQAIAEELDRRQKDRSDSRGASARSSMSAKSTGSSRAKDSVRSSTPNLEDLPEELSNVDISAESPTKPQSLKNRPRTSLARAQTMFVNSPADVSMTDRTPVPSIATLGLSPRRTGARKPSKLSRNIFAVASSSSPSPVAVDDIEDEEEEIALPSPTRGAISNDPFKSATCRPDLKRQATAPAHKIDAAATLFKRRAASPPALEEKENPMSPARRTTKLGGPPPGSPTKFLKGRTLVELTQATVWDPERDDMPSPFLHKAKTMMPGAQGGPGKGHLR